MKITRGEKKSVGTQTESLREESMAGRKENTSCSHVVFQDDIWTC